MDNRARFLTMSQPYMKCCYFYDKTNMVYIRLFAIFLVYPAWVFENFRLNIEQMCILYMLIDIL